MNAFRPEEIPMTPEEAQAVVRRHLEAIPQGTSAPNVADVAEALGVAPEEVARLLDEVRAKPNLAPRKAPRWGVLVPAALVASFAMLIFLRAATPRVVDVPSPPAAMPVPQDFNVVMEGVGERTTESIPATAEALMPVLDDMARTGTGGVTQTATSEQAAKDLAAIAAGRWSGPGLSERTVTVRRLVSSGKYVRWIRARLPFYDADDPKVDDLVVKERRRRLEEAVREPS